MDGNTNETDYSSFEYQQAVANTSLTPEGGDATNPQLDFLYDIEPLARIGGLDNNEVAELVYLETQVSIEPESEQSDADQTVANAIEMRGVVGANIDVGGGLNELGEINRGESSNERAVSGRFLSLIESNRDEVFQQFSARAIPPNDDINTDVPDSYASASGGSLDSGIRYEKAYRQLTGRGPVLDNNDSINVSGSIIAGDQVQDFGGEVRLHMIWDVAQTDEAGRAFSVPM